MLGFFLLEFCWNSVSLEIQVFFIPATQSVALSVSLSFFRRGSKTLKIFMFKVFMGGGEWATVRSKARGLDQHGGLPAGWLEESDPPGCDFVRDGRSMPPALTDHTALSWADL
jgi:hypothetical protein